MSNQGRLWVRHLLACAVVLLGLTLPCSSVAALPVALDETALEASLLELTNAARVAAGLEPLEADGGLAGAARQHAAEMAELGYFSHSSPVPANATLGARVARAGSFLQTLGENLALVGSEDTAQASVSGWLGSPGHRANLLSPDFTHVGFGVAPQADGRVAVAQVFGHQPGTLLGADLVSVLEQTTTLEVQLELTAAAEVAVFYAERSSPASQLSAGHHTLSVPLLEPPSLPLPVQLGVRSTAQNGGAADTFILLDDGWLQPHGWEGSGGVAGAQGRLLNVALGNQLGRTFELRLAFATPLEAELGAWQGETNAQLKVAGSEIRVQLPDPASGLPLQLGERQGGDRYRVVYSFMPQLTGAPSVIPVTP